MPAEGCGGDPVRDTEFKGNVSLLKTDSLQGAHLLCDVALRHTLEKNRCLVSRVDVRLQSRKRRRTERNVVHYPGGDERGAGEEGGVGGQVEERVGDGGEDAEVGGEVQETEDC